MTRSGVFNSVHSFTQSAIGPTILGFLAMALIWSVFLLAVRVDKLEGEPGTFHGTSREAMFLVNNLLLRALHVHGAHRHGVPAAGRGDAGAADERRPAVLRQDGRADRSGAAVPDRRRSGAALGTRDARADAARAAAAPHRGARVSRGRIRLRRAERMDAAHARLRRLRGAGHDEGDVASVREADPRRRLGRPRARRRPARTGTAALRRLHRPR